MPDNRYDRGGRPRRGNANGRPQGGYRSSRGRRTSVPPSGETPQLVTRRKVIKGLIGAVFGVGALQLARHQIFYHDINMQRLSDRREVNSPLYAKRGTLYDRNGNVLASSEECYNIALNTQKITDRDDVVDALVEHLGVERSRARELTGKDTTWIYVKLQADIDEAEALMATGLSGIEYESTVKRVYPYGSTASQVLGVVGTDNTGITGLELQYEEELRGTDGWIVRERAADGSYIAGGAYSKQDAVDGNDLVLTIDVNIQQTAEEVIAEAVESFGAQTGTVLVTIPSTGEILAACSYPTYNPTDLSSARTEDMNLRAVTDAYEPGSVFKALVCGAAIDMGVVDTDTTFTVPPVVMAGDDEVTDTDDRDYTMDMSVREIMRRSSNTGMILVGEQIGADKFAEYIDAYGIGQRSGIDFPGENTGIVRDRADYDGASVAAMSFGQSLSVAPVELVRAVSAIANAGVMTTPHFVRARRGEEVDWTDTEKRAISEEAAVKVADMMRTVVDEGTGTTGQVLGYDVSAKTGTAQRASESGGYIKNSYTASFMGFAPTDDPAVQVYVMIDGTANLSTVVGESFATILQTSLEALGVRPTS